MGCEKRLSLLRQIHRRRRMRNSVRCVESYNVDDVTYQPKPQASPFGNAPANHARYTFGGLLTNCYFNDKRLLEVRPVVEVVRKCILMDRLSDEYIRNLWSNPHERKLR